MNRMTTLTAVIILIFGTVPAFGFSLASPLFQDLLHTTPQILEKGVILPGDQAAVACHETKDLLQPLTFDRAVDMALCNNPQLKYSWANIKVQAGALGEARAPYLPTVTGSLNRTHDRTIYPDSKLPTTDLWRTTFQTGISWRIFDFGGRSAGHRAAAHTLAAALNSHNAALQKVLGDAIQAYFDAMTAHATAEAAEESERNARATLKSAKAREEGGAVSQSDRLRSTTALAKAVLENNRARGDYRKALAWLGQVMGLPGNTGITLPEEIVPDTREMAKDLTGWLEEAQKNHPAIAAARDQLAAARDQVIVARSVGLPTLNSSANYYRNTKPGEAVTAREAREYTMGIGLTIPFFDGFSNTYRIRGAEARVEQKKAELADTETRIGQEMVRAYVFATVALENLSASADLLETAQEALTVSRRRYDKGAADITELLGTQLSLSEAQRERIRCLAEWNSARLGLLTSAGRMGRSAVQGIDRSR